MGEGIELQTPWRREPEEVGPALQRWAAATIGDAVELLNVRSPGNGMSSETVLFETRETARGLILSMSNVLFDFNMATLRPEAREKLAKLAGIVLATPGLRLSVEGHADAIGSDEYNQKLSERRAGSVRDYLVGQGVDGASVTARGFGESQPIASNDTAEGRQQNRRVEIVVSGEVIGVAEAR